MKNFEERFTAWVDSTMDEKQRIAFEEELATKPEWMQTAETDRQMGELMRSCLDVPPLNNSDFFNHQIMENVRRLSAASESQKVGWWERLRLPLPRYVLASGVAVFVGVLMVQGMRDKPDSEPVMTVSVDAQDMEVIKVSTTDPAIYAEGFIDPGKEFTVLWVEGLDYLPATYAMH